MDVAGLVLSAGSFAIQLGQLGEQLFGSAPAALPYTASDGEALGLAMYHEYRQTTLLANVLSAQKKFNLDGTIFDAMSASDQDMCLAILNRLLRLWSEFRSFHSSTFTEGGIDPLQTLEDGRVIELNQVKQIVQDQAHERLTTLLDSAAGWNSRLERTVRNFTWTCSLEAGSLEETLNRLNTVARDADAEALDWSTPAMLRGLSLTISNPAIDRSSLAIRGLRASGDLLDGKNIRPDGVVQTQIRDKSGTTKVLVESFPFKKQDESHEDMVLRRVEQLAALLHVQKSHDFRLPAAFCFAKDSKRSQFVILFKLAVLTSFQAAEIFTLQSLLQKSPHSRPSLGLRFELAHILARALSNIQSIGWVHQNYRSENIVFLARPGTTNHAQDIPYSEPWIFGHGTSRFDNMPSANLYDPDPVRNLYRHPSRWGVPIERFNKLHDIYSLGVCLLEIGYWAHIPNLISRDCAMPKADPMRARQQLLDLSVNPRISNLMGEAYAAITELCLRSTTSAFGFEEEQDDKNDSLLQQRFSERVVFPLQKATDALLGRSNLQSKTGRRRQCLDARRNREAGDKLFDTVQPDKPVYPSYGLAISCTIDR
ncbi:Protein kinase-like (PK-like) [Ilyonectria robusta]